VTEHVDVVVVGPNSETTEAYALPLGEDFLHLEFACRLGGVVEVAKTEGPFVGPITGVTFDL